ncbi:MAG: hypothetical protein ACRDN0_00335 [Trebonia sp.]
MYSHGFTKSRLAAVGAVACLAATVAACGSASSGGSSTGNSAASVSPKQAVLLAATSAAKVNTFSGTFNLQGTVKEAGASGPINVAGTVSGQLHPSLMVSENFGTFSAGGENLGPTGIVFTTKDAYLKMAGITQALHTSKPWIELPISAISAKSGLNFSSLMSQMQNSSPLASIQMLAGASDVKNLGQSSVGGVPVTEYSGVLTMTKAIDALPADTRAALQQETAAAGIKTSSFKVWLDSGNQARKAVIVEKGSTVSETITVTMTSMNQPVNISAPPASQVTSVPASVLSGS